MEEKTMTSPAAEETKAAAGQAAAGAAAAGTGTEPAKEKLYDQAYIDRLLADQKKAQEDAVAEALKVAAMDADKKAQYEKEQAEKKQSEREAKIARRELRADAREVLEKKDVPKEFLDMLLGSDLKETEANVDTFKGIFDRAVQAQVEKRLAGKTPAGGSGAPAGSREAMSAEMDKYL